MYEFILFMNCLNLKDEKKEKKKKIQEGRITGRDE